MSVLGDRPGAQPLRVPLPAAVGSGRLVVPGLGAGCGLDGPLPSRGLAASDESLPICGPLSARSSWSACCELADRQIGELSGGQQRRAFLARALAQDPEVYLLDEPVTGVDPKTEDDLMALLNDERQRGKTIVASTHDLAGVAEHFTRLLSLNRSLDRRRSSRAGARPERAARDVRRAPDPRRARRRGAAGRRASPARQSLTTDARPAPGAAVAGIHAARAAGVGAGWRVDGDGGDVCGVEGPGVHRRCDRACCVSGRRDRVHAEAADLSGCDRRRAGHRARHRLGQPPGRDSPGYCHRRCLCRRVRRRRAADEHAHRATSAT